MAFMRQQVMRGYSPRETLNQQYNVARNNLLLVLAFTVINCALALLGQDLYFLFSAFIPYYAVLSGMVLCGKMPEEFYRELGQTAESATVFTNGFFILMLAIGIVSIALYFLAWLLSKNHKVGWLIFALVFFSVDTLATFYLMGLDVTMIVNYIFHALVIFELARGIYAHNKWKKISVLDAENVVLEDAGVEGETAEADVPADTTPLRSMDRDIKSRTLAEAEYQGHKILYRRANKVNELIVDGMVYDEYVAKLERQHQLYAQIGGHDICAGYNGSKSYILVDGDELASKIRWY